MSKEAGDTWRAGPAFQSHPRQAQGPGSTEGAGTSQLPISHPGYKADARTTPDPSALTSLKRGKALNCSPALINTSFKSYQKFF